MQSTSQALDLLGRRLAAFAGAFTALVSLFSHVPVRIACLRGAVAFAGVLLLTRAACFALERSLAADRARSLRRAQP